MELPWTLSTRARRKLAGAVDNVVEPLVTAKGHAVKPLEQSIGDALTLVIISSSRYLAGDALTLIIATSPCLTPSRGEHSSRHSRPVVDMETRSSP
ncbi:hypothetical protein E2562_017087 [Oryza meyeriana var. granulata]|uniref:Uncharacterized protein n=1 Tax=Oryza meyeriana var. granulata TaxID=110450 RepID=A0A6G1F911_9ORYZ|nr:hypothetical protein E2562_017087 [Oryza meyeriana var. granulata]